VTKADKWFLKGGGLKNFQFFNPPPFKNHLSAFSQTMKDEGSNFLFFRK